MRLFNKDPLANAKKYGYNSYWDIVFNEGKKVNKYKLNEMGWARTELSINQDKMIRETRRNALTLDNVVKRSPTDFEVFLYKKNKFYEYIIHFVAISMTPKTIYGLYILTIQLMNLWK